MKGQFTIEMLVAFVIFIAVIGIFIGIGQTQLTETQKAVKNFEAKLTAEKCATIIDFFSQGNDSDINAGEKCIVEGGKKFVKAEFGKTNEAQSAILNNKTSITETEIKVESRGHYRYGE